MKDLDELFNSIDLIDLEPTPANMDRILNILGQLIQHVQRLEKLAKRANDTASCIANGIQPD